MQPSARPKWVQGLMFLGGMAAVALIGWLVMQLLPQKPLPEGWLRLTPPRDVMALVAYQGEIWAGGRDGVVALDPADGSVLREVVADVPMDYVTGIATSDRSGDLWISHMRGVSHYNGVGWSTLTEANGLTAGRALAVLVAGDGSLWVGTEQGVARCRQDQCRGYTAGDGLVTTGCAYLFEDSRSRIWCGNGYVPEAGVSIFDGTRWQSMPDQDRLIHPMLNTMLETPDGALWFGLGFSAEGGLTVNHNGTWQSLTKTDGLAGAKVRYLFQDQAGGIWIGSEYNGMLYLGSHGLDNLGSGQIFTPDEGLAGFEVKAMLQDSQGTLWLGTELGLTRMSYEAWQSLAD
ncbi:MAG: hypothetical protein JXC32_00280 [Anaerolineae bacterium]|nr:hypothetical protein [Anaerolineae bacterium]